MIPSTSSLTSVTGNGNNWPGWRPDCFVHTQVVCTCCSNHTFVIGPTASNTSAPLDGEWVPPAWSKLGGWIGLFDGAYVPPEPPELRAERPPTAGRPAVVPSFRREPRRNPRSASRRGKVEAAP